MAVRGIFRTCCVLLVQFLMVYLDHVHPEETAVIRKCSCYTFHGSETLSWNESRQECKKTGGDLVSMETKREWEFIRHAIKSRSTARNENEWHIGLMKNNRIWTWVSGTRLNWAECNSTGCLPWQKHQPSGGKEKVALMAKSYPKNTEGLFNDITTNGVKRGFICEHVTDICLGGAVERCFNTTRTIQRTTQRKPVFPPTTPLTTITKKPSPGGTVTNKQKTVPPQFPSTALPTTAKKFMSTGTVTNKQSTQKSWKQDTFSQSPTTRALPTTTGKLTSGGTETNKQHYTEKSREHHTIRAIVPSQSSVSGRPERGSSGDSPNTLVIVAATSTVVVLLVILSVMVALLWRKKSHMRRGRSIRIKKKSNARGAAQTRGQLTFVFDGDRVYATMDWSKTKKKKRQEDFAYTDLINGNVIHETVRPALPTIYADIRSARVSCTDNQEGNIPESGSPTNKSIV